MPSSRLTQLLQKDLIFFKENEERNIKKLRELNRALVEHLRVMPSFIFTNFVQIYHNIGMEMLEQEMRLSEEEKRKWKAKESELKLRQFQHQDKRYAIQSGHMLAILRKWN